MQAISHNDCTCTIHRHTVVMEDHVYEDVAMVFHNEAFAAREGEEFTLSECPAYQGISSEAVKVPMPFKEDMPNSKDEMTTCPAYNTLPKTAKKVSVPKWPTLDLVMPTKSMNSITNRTDDDYI